MELVVVTDSDRNLRSYDGATDKFGATLGGVDYIVKFSSTGLTSELYSEHVASSFIRNLGVPAHETRLCIYNERMAVLLKDFTFNGWRLRTFKHAIQSSGNMEPTYSSYTLPVIMNLIYGSTHMSTEIKKAIASRFWEMLVCDAILGNADRHWGNWGYLAMGSRYAPAPIYDNAGSLQPELGVQVQAYVRDKVAFLAPRTCRHPSSKIRSADRKNKRLNYNTLFTNPEILKTTEEFRSSLSLSKVAVAAIDATADIPEPYRDFYIYYICVRYLRIMLHRDMEDAFVETEMEIKKWQM